MHPRSEGEVVHHTYYSLCYVEQAEQASWVSYTLTPEMVSGSTPRKDAFRVDPLVSTASAHPNDYKSSGYDRGHLAPAASMSCNAVAMSESFFMSNMSPQLPAFNRGGWKRLEELVRSWSVERGLIHVVSGSVLNDVDQYIGENRVAVPKHYYKVIYDPNKQQMIAFIVPNAKLESDLRQYVQSVDSLEQLTGIDFFPALNDDIESVCEAHSRSSLWQF